MAEETNIDMDLFCPICFSGYSEVENKPIILRCGHTHCEKCFRNIVITNRKCGECRAAIKSRDLHSMTTNYAILRVVNSIKEKETAQLEEFTTLDSRLWTIIQNLSKRKNLYKERIENLKSKVERIDELQMDLISERQKLKSESLSLLKCSTLVELSQQVAKSKNIIEGFEKKILNDSCRLQIDLAEEKFVPLLENPSHYYIKHKGHNELYSVILAKKGKVYMEHANPTLSLRDNTKIVEFEDIYPFIIGSFMVIKWRDRTYTLEYELQENKRSEQFIQMCIGDKGPCFLETKFFNPSRIGLEGESISGGDYENNNGTGGKATLARLNDGEVENVAIKAGHVVGSEGTIFTIYLEDWPPTFTNKCFGKLLTGLGFLKNAIRSKFPIKVNECGLVFDFKKKPKSFSDSMNDALFLSNESDSL